jgi:(1->4)-alpha-D-glucan 1-alpha-D-glucosylmutase
VGSDPGTWGRSPEEVHRANAERLRRFPRGLLATQTHDTKRSGDVRARIGALSLIPEEWRAAVTRWWAMNAAHRRDGAPTPDEEYLIYQTLVGAWPLEQERLRDYMVKAMREAKVATGWIEPDEAHEGAVGGFIAALYGSEGFTADLERFLERAAPLGETSALGQTLLKLTSPGVPDVYQGDELWDLALVDPDNRRPVDWQERRRALAALAAGAAPTRATRKLHLIRRALDLRARRPEPFAGAYRPLAADPAAFAYARGDAIIAAMPLTLAGPDAVIEVPDDLRGPWSSALTGDAHDLGRQTSVAALAGDFPVALLERA